ncbi:MAG: hypothetical protein GYB36_02160 [Alphaproteobacteria bacterium]|nr:hypothetical protein [Alphaproteobacteria bacterium]
MKKVMSAFGLALVFSGAVFAQPIDWRERLTEEDLEAGQIHLGMLFNGEADGFMRLGWYRDGDNLHLWDRTMFASQEVYELYEARVNADSLSPQEVRIDFHTGETSIRWEIGFTSDAANGVMSMSRPGEDAQERSIEAPLPGGVLLRAQTFMLVDRVELDPGESFSVDWYSSLSNAVETVTFSAIETVDIETPGGAFTTIRIEQRGGEPANDFFVDVETRRIVRIDVGGQPMSFVRLAEPA